MSEFTLSEKIPTLMAEYAKNNDRPFLSFEFFPPKTEVSMLNNCFLAVFDEIF
jgi:5,10-methylenetetrahydrofolate reductase